MAVRPREWYLFAVIWTMTSQYVTEKENTIKIYGDFLITL